jgi:signal transduction histidine kinase
MVLRARMKISIRRSLTIWYCIVFCVSVCLLETGVYVGLDSAMTHTIDKELGIRLNGLDDFLKEHLSRFSLARVLQDLVIHVTLQPDLAIIQNEQGQTLFCGALVQPLCASSINHPSMKILAERNLRAQTSVRSIVGAQYTLLVATDLHFQHDLLTRFRMLFFLIVPLALGCAIVGGYWLSGLALAPVREIITSVRSINDRSLSLRLRVPATGDEIQLLSETLNSMLARVEKSFRQVTELTANASHELRTPLAIIRTASEVALLNAKPSLESHRRALLQICAEAEKNTRLLDSMLMLARTDSGVQPLNLISINLQDSIEKAANVCRYLAEAKRIDLRILTQPIEVVVWADAVQLHRLWLLLIDNAIKYTPEGGVITVQVRSDPSGAPVCEIIDSGIGIPDNNLAEIFNRFFRAENARMQSDVGSGLGLTIGQWITDAHRAQIEVESKVGQGSIFRVVFPVEPERPKNIVSSISLAMSTVPPLEMEQG